MQKYYLLDDIDEKIEFSINSIIVAADPCASAKLADRSIKYSILEDYYDESALWQHEYDFYNDQLRWFAKLDQFIQEKIGFCQINGLNLATLNYLRIKYFVDMVIIYSKSLSGLVKKIPAGVPLTYVYCSKDSFRPSIFNFVSQNRFLFKSVLEALCQLKNIPLECINTFQGPSGVKAAPKTSGSCFFKKVLRSFKNLFYLKKHQTFFCKSKKEFSNKKICFLHAGSLDVDLLVEAFYCRGGKTFIQSEESIYFEGGVLSRPVFSADRVVCSKIRSDCTQAAATFSKENEIVKWISNHCGVDVRIICEPYLKSFIEDELPPILSSASQQTHFFNSFGIDAVVVRGNTDRIAVIALIAAQCSEKTKRICIQHSGLAINKNIFPVFETCSYDYLWTRDDLSQRYFEREQVNSFSSPCVISQSAHVARLLSSKARRIPVGANKRQRIVYLETRFPSHVRAFGNPTYSLPAYYEFQKRLIDFMVAQSEIDWIFKHAPRDDYQSPIVQYIKKKNAPNIMIESVPFTECVKSVDKVFMDFFSTAFYESIFYKKPVLCLKADYFDWIPEMEEAFGAALNSFSSVDDAVQKLKAFIDEPLVSQKYRPKISYNNQSVNNFFSDFLQNLSTLSG